MHIYKHSYTKKEINKESNEEKNTLSQERESEREMEVCMRIVFGAETSLKTWRVAAEVRTGMHGMTEMPLGGGCIGNERG